MTAQADLQRRRNIRRNLFGSVGELADLDHQRATWLDPEMQNPHYSYVEFIECFYDAAAIAYDAPNTPPEGALFVLDGDVSEAEREAIWPVHVALRDYKEPLGDCDDHEAILNDPAWRHVCGVASRARDKLLTMVDPTERAYFVNVLPIASAKRWP